ncbi:MAG: hypothetical protein QXU32_13505 [Nitrososphaerales archaeon]
MLKQFLKRIDEAVSKHDSDKGSLMGFIDESSLRFDPNKSRVVNTEQVIYSEGNSRSKTIFGFMALDGNDVAMVSDRAKAHDMISFLELIRKENSARDIFSSG